MSFGVGNQCGLDIFVLFTPRKQFGPQKSASWKIFTSWQNTVGKVSKTFWLYLLKDVSFFLVLVTDLKENRRRDVKIIPKHSNCQQSILMLHWWPTVPILDPTQSASHEEQQLVLSPKQIVSHNMKWNNKSYCKKFINLLLWMSVYHCIQTLQHGLLALHKGFHHRRQITHLNKSKQWIKASACEFGSSSLLIKFDASWTSSLCATVVIVLRGKFFFLRFR